MCKKNKIDKIRKAQAECCKKCEEKNGKKDIDECFNCQWHKIYNLLLELEGED